MLYCCKQATSIEETNVVVLAVVVRYSAFIPSQPLFPFVPYTGIRIPLFILPTTYLETPTATAASPLLQAQSEGKSKISYSSWRSALLPGLSHVGGSVVEEQSP